MYGAAVATLLSYTVMALLLGNYSKRVMYVPYRLPESFTLVLFLGGIVFLESFLSNLAGNIYAKIVLIGIGLAALAIYLYKLVDTQIDRDTSSRAAPQRGAYLESNEVPFSVV